MPARRRTLAWMLPLPAAWGPGVAHVLQIDPLARGAVQASGAWAGLALLLIAVIVAQRTLGRQAGDEGRPASAARCARRLAFWVAVFGVARWVADHHDPRVPYIEAVSVLVSTLALGWTACMGVFLTVHPLGRGLAAQAHDRPPGLRAAYMAGAGVLGLLASAGLGVAMSARSAGEVDRARLAELEAIADLLAEAVPRIGAPAALDTLRGELYIDGAVMPADRPPAVFAAADAVVEEGGRWLLLFGEARFHLVQRAVGGERLWLWQTAGIGPPVRAPDDASPLLILALLMLGAPIGAGLIGHDAVAQLRPIDEALGRMGRQAADEAADGGAGEVPHGSNDEFGDLAAVVNGTVRRFTAQNQRLAAELGAAAGSDRTRTGFLHTASYELRTPLTTITGYCHLLRQTDLSHAQREDVRVIADASAQLLAHVDEILDLSRIEAGEESPLQLAPVDLGAVAREEMAGHTDRTAPGVQSRLEITDGLPPVRADRARVKQVVANLVGNALKFTETGWVELRVAPTTETLRGGPAVHLSVQDTGPGIPAVELEAIFVEFHRVAEQRAVAGTGLGLAIARRLVERHGGRLWAESIPGEGSTFHLLLPVHGPPDTPDAPEPTG